MVTDRRMKRNAIKMDEYMRVRALVVKGAVEVMPFDYSGFRLIYESTVSGLYTTLTRMVYEGEIKGVPCGVTYQYISGFPLDPFGEAARYWCKCPDTAGLARLPRDAELQMFADLFGP